MLFYMSILFSGSQSQNGSFLRFCGVFKSWFCVHYPNFQTCPRRALYYGTPKETRWKKKNPLSEKYCIPLETLCSLAKAWNIVFAPTSHYFHHRSFASKYKVSHGNAKVQKHWITMWLKNQCGKKTNSVLDLLIHWKWLLESKNLESESEQHY